MYTLDPLLPLAVSMMQLQNEYPLLQERQAALKYWWLLHLPPGETLKNSAFCPQHTFVCFV